MDAVTHGFGLGLQLAASGAVFGLAHAVWGLFPGGSIIAVLSVVSETGVFGLALAVYLIHCASSPIF